MKKVSLAVLLSLSAVASAYAQSEQGVTMSTDPARIADIESRAQNLQSQQSSMQNMQMDQSTTHKSGHHKKSHGKSMQHSAE
ncbi:hypothetical protein P9239_10240 [Caballeronia sp. LZ062]|uniref:hypothetical protein n=1 Tax=unclassified Caballeronia TaxID=2646786 RepID=UPI00285A5C7C|nr:MULTISPECIES: hypothetical protein [unclassified Caballeronia]MDR5854747.1 hypothetical protein [Caballeronia sp. LZ050]MDR5870724.1 hypothetical protein [Caballeronia sp. LZ062]